MMRGLLEPFRYPNRIAGPDLAAAAQQQGKRKERARNGFATVGRLWRYLAVRRWSIALVLCMVVLSTSLALLGPYLIGYMIDTYMGVHSSRSLGFMLLVLAAVYLLHSISLWLQNYWMIGIAQETVLEMRNALFRQLHRLPIPYFDKRQHGELMSRVTNDIENVSSTLNSSVIQVFSSVLMLTGTVVVMLILSPLLTLLTFLIIPAMFLGMRWITKRTSVRFKELQRHLGQMNGFVEETISGQRIVKTFSQEEKVIAEFRQRNEQYRLSGFWAQTISGFIPKLMNTLNNLGFAMIACVGGILAYHGQITVGVILVFVEYARQFTRPLHDLSNQFNTLLSAIAGAERVFDVMDEQPESVDEQEAAALEEMRGDVRFDRVSFGYGQDEHVLRQISFRAAAGQTIALVGPTGAGKTTLINLLTRFYEPAEGQITVDGIDLRAIMRESLRSHMAVVLQDSVLFHGSVMDNIRFGRLEAMDEEVIAAAKLANAHPFIMKLSHGYDTVIDHDGGGISQGQKQLLAIARAILAKPRLLILDEATSNIDTVTEIKIQEALQRLMQGRTSFVIAHRLNTIRSADLIIVLRDGGIIEQGSHEQLMEQQGYYRELYDSFRPA